MYAFFFTLFYGGILHSVDSMRLNPGLASAAEEIARVKHDIGADAYLLVDGNFQPHLADVRNVGILQNFAGNPRLLGEEDFKKATDVITLYDLSQVGDCGAFVREGKDFPSYQWDRLEAYCRWIRDVPKATWRGPRSGLLHYKILRN